MWRADCICLRAACVALGRLSRRAIQHGRSMRSLRANDGGRSQATCEMEVRSVFVYCVVVYTRLPHCRLPSAERACPLQISHACSKGADSPGAALFPADFTMANSGPYDRLHAALAACHLMADGALSMPWRPARRASRLPAGSAPAGSSRVPRSFPQPLFRGPRRCRANDFYNIGVFFSSMVYLTQWCLLALFGASWF